MYQPWFSRLEKRPLRSRSIGCFVLQCLPWFSFFLCRWFCCYCLSVALVDHCTIWPPHRRWSSARYSFTGKTWKRKDWRRGSRQTGLLKSLHLLHSFQSLLHSFLRHLHSFRHLLHSFLRLLHSFLLLLQSYSQLPLKRPLTRTADMIRITTGRITLLSTTTDWPESSKKNETEAV